MKHTVVFGAELRGTGCDWAVALAFQKKSGLTVDLKEHPAAQEFAHFTNLFALNKRKVAK